MSQRHQMSCYEPGAELLINENRMRFEAKNRIDRDQGNVATDILQVLEINIEREMDQDTADLMGAEFIHGASNLVCALFGDPAEHHAPAYLLHALFEVHHDLGWSVKA